MPADDLPWRDLYPTRRSGKSTNRPYHPSVKKIPAQKVTSYVSKRVILEFVLDSGTSGEFTVEKVTVRTTGTLRAYDPETRIASLEHARGILRVAAAEVYLA
jgi:hypothetical protein